MPAAGAWPESGPAGRAGRVTYMCTDASRIRRRVQLTSTHTSLTSPQDKIFDPLNSLHAREHICEYSLYLNRENMCEHILNSLQQFTPRENIWLAGRAAAALRRRASS